MRNILIAAVCCSMLGLSLGMTVNATSPSVLAYDATATAEQPLIASAQWYSMTHQGMQREFLLYIPEGISEDAPLVIVLHGYGGKAGRGGERLCEVAEREKFAVCYPQGAADTTGHSCWNVGYPFQEGLETDDVDFICTLAEHLQQKYLLSHSHTFLTGMSNGGEMCYLMAYKRPEAFAAIAPIAGLTLKWMRDSLTPQSSVPMMEVHGTEDQVSLWEGDLENAGGWGAYIPVLEAVETWINEAGCTDEVVEELPLLKESSHQVFLHRWTGGEPTRVNGKPTEIRLYKIIGGTHCWGEDDMNTCEEIWKFFSQYCG